MQFVGTVDFESSYSTGRIESGPFHAPATSLPGDEPTLLNWVGWEGTRAGLDLMQRK